ncbi:MAG: hypothetical protein ACRD7E_26550, partial [Bryobacteraceae bacterium]
GSLEVCPKRRVVSYEQWNDVTSRFIKESIDFRLSLCAAVCRRVLPFGAPKGQENGNVVLCTTSS